MNKELKDKRFRIQGMQHIGIATSDMDRSLRLYRKLFGMNIPFFDSVQAAPLMDSHTRGETITKRASMVMNLQGGCAFEVLRPTSFEPKPAGWTIAPGDLGLTAVQMKTPDIERMHRHALSFQAEGVRVDAALRETQWGAKTFYLRDPDDTLFQVLEASDWFERPKHPSGGVMGCTIGVSNIDRSLALYADRLGYSVVLFDEVGTFDDWAHLPNGTERYRRVRLMQPDPGAGGIWAGNRDDVHRIGAGA